MELGDKFRLVLANTLREDGFPDSGHLFNSNNILWLKIKLNFNLLNVMLQLRSFDKDYFKKSTNF